MKLHWKHFPWHFCPVGLVAVEEVWGLYAGDIHIGNVWDTSHKFGRGWLWSAGCEELGIPVESGCDFATPMDAMEAMLMHVGLAVKPELAGGNQ